MKSKVFGIGFHKTGTKSLASALRQLGYRVTGPNCTQDPQIATRALGLAHDLVGQFDAFQDNPWPMLYREMDSTCPGSKFILTVRDTTSWIESLIRYFGNETSPMREWIYGYGSPVGNETTYTRLYDRHNREVRDYFRRRPHDLLVLDFMKDDGWPQICDFLGVEPPAAPFPHENRAR